VGPFLSLLALGFSVASTPNETEVQLMAGAAEIAVNPLYPDTEGLEAYGDLYARTLVLGHGTQRIAIVTVDVGTLLFPLSTSCSGRLAMRLAFPRETSPSTGAIRTTPPLSNQAPIRNG
jgi:hypothetical protein